MTLGRGNTSSRDPEDSSLTLAGDIAQQALKFIARGQEISRSVVVWEEMVNEIWNRAKTSKRLPDKIECYEFLIQHCTGDKAREWLATMAKVKESLRPKEESQPIIVKIVNRMS